MAEHTSPWEAEMLNEFARAFPYPPTPDIAGRVAARVAAGRGSTAPSVWRLRVATAALAALGMAVATLAVSRDARDAVAEFLGLSVEGERIEVLPTPVSGLPTALPAPVDIGERARGVTLAEATELGGGELVGFDDREVLAVYVLEPVNAPVVVILRYEGFDLWQFRTSGEPNFEKGVIDGSVVEEAGVNGRDAYWIAGGQRLVTLLDDEGTPVAGTQRTVLAPTLLWHDGERYLRIEGIANRDEAIAVAEGVR